LPRSEATGRRLPLQDALPALAEELVLAVGW
jgi:hypothetical protein